MFKVVEIDSGIETETFPEGIGAFFAYDGTKWISHVNNSRLYKFDVTDIAAGSVMLTDYDVGVRGLAFDRDTGMMVVSTNVPGESTAFRLETWNVETKEMTVLLDETASQSHPDVDGHVVVYTDSQTSGYEWGSNQNVEIRIFDRESGVIRTVMPMNTYYGLGIWEHWIAVNNVGTWGDSLIVCDLLEGGLMDASGHVCPESGCPEPDPDTDSGTDSDTGTDSGGG